MIFEELQNFIVEHNVMNLLVAVVVGKTFSEFVSSVISYLIMPIVIFTTGKTDFTKLKLEIGSLDFSYGQVINSFLIFITTLISIYYIFIKPFNSITGEQINYQKKISEDVSEIKKTVEDYQEKRKYLR